MVARLSLAQQIAQLEDTAPVDYDPEDLYGGNANENKVAGEDGDADMDKNPEAGREHYIDVGPSALRKLHDSVSDPKYDGVRTTRDKIFGDDEDEDMRDESENGEAPLSLHDDDGDGDDDGEEEEDGSEEESEEEKEQRGSKRKSSPSGEDNAKASPEDEALVRSLQRTRIAEKEKGQAVKQQLRIWDSLVDARIRLQKSVVSANKLPHPNKISSFTQNDSNHEVVQQFLIEALKLSEDVLELRRTLLEKSGVEPPPRKKRRIEDELEGENIDFESLLKQSTEDLMEFEAQTHSNTLTTLQKWSAKVQAVAPAALLSAGRVSFKSGVSSFKSAGELIDEALREPERLIKKTWCVNGARIGGEDGDGVQKEREVDQGDEETFDDREFYQGMLRDVIESKGGKDVAADLYANRQPKKKKPVDTKASKGRKIRYEPHEKLQNFMVPVPVRGAWHEEQIDELFASLLGKGFEGATVNGHAAATEGPEQEEVRKDVMNGFRLFG